MFIVKKGTELCLVKLSNWSSIEQYWIKNCTEKYWSMLNIKWVKILFRIDGFDYNGFNYCQYTYTSNPLVGVVSLHGKIKRYVLIVLCIVLHFIDESLHDWLASTWYIEVVLCFPDLKASGGASTLHKSERFPLTPALSLYNWPMIATASQQQTLSLHGKNWRLSLCWKSMALIPLLEAWERGLALP